MRVGLGTGTTVAELVPALARRRLAITCVATSPATAGAGRRARARRAAVHRHRPPRPGHRRSRPGRPGSAGWSRAEGAPTPASGSWPAAADRFVVIVSSDKPVERLHPPCRSSCWRSGSRPRCTRCPSAVLRDAPPTPDAGVLADYHGAFDDPADLAAVLDAVPGVVSHGLFPPSMVTTVLIGRGDEVEERQIV